MQTLGFVRGTTPTLVVRVRGYSSLEDAERVCLTLRSKSSRKSIDFDRDRLVLSDMRDVDTSSIVLTLTQAETLSFREGDTVEVQARIRNDGDAMATKIGSLRVYPVLKDGEI